MTVRVDRGSTRSATGSVPSAPRRRAAQGQRLRRRLLSIVVGAAGLGALLALIPRMQPVYAFDVVIAPLGLRAGSTVILVLVGLTLIATARQLSRGKRAAWWVSVVLLGVAIVMAVVQRGHVGAALFGGALLVALVAYRRDFEARPDPPSVWRALWFALIWAVSVLTLGMAALLAEGRRMTPEFDVVGALQTIGAGLIGLDGQYTYSNPLFARAFPAALLALSVFGLAVVASLIFRASTAPRRVGPAQRRRAEQLVRTFGSDTLSYFALRDDKSYFFSSDGRAMVAYAYLRDHALVSGDPIGSPESFGLVIDEFLDFCHGHGWKAAFLAVDDARLPIYRERGLVDMYLGDEAVVHCASLSLEGRAHRNARQAVGRAVRSHHSFELMPETDADALLLRDLSAISTCWRGDGNERGFGMTMGQGVPGTDPEVLLAIARDSAGRPVGFLRLVPCFGSPMGYSLDLMRRLPNSVNGVMEYLIHETAAALAARGVSTLSLNFAVWARLQPADAELGPVDRVLKWGADRSGQQVKSLYSFNEKFSPEWRPRSVVAESSADLPRVWILYGGVEGFFSRVPVLGAMMTPRIVAD